MIKEKTTVKVLSAKELEDMLKEQKDHPPEQICVLDLKHLELLARDNIDDSNENGDA